MHISLFVSGFILAVGGLAGSLALPGVAGVQSAIAFVAGCVLVVGGALLERLVIISRIAEAAASRHEPHPQPLTPTAASSTSVTGDPLPPPK